MSATTEPAVPAAPRTAWSDRIFSLPVVLGLLLVYLLLFVSAGGQRGADPGGQRHLVAFAERERAGARSGHFIRVESYTFTVAGKPWINFEWLGELPYYFAYRWLGDRGLYLVTVR